MPSIRTEARHVAPINGDIRWSAEFVFPHFPVSLLQIFVQSTRFIFYFLFREFVVSFWRICCDFSRNGNSTLKGINWQLFVCFNETAKKFNNNFYKNIWANWKRFNCEFYVTQSWVNTEIKQVRETDCYIPGNLLLKWYKLRRIVYFMHFDFAYKHIQSINCMISKFISDCNRIILKFTQGIR